MKAFSIFALLVLSFFAHAAATKEVIQNSPNPVIRSSNDTTFSCGKYTSNTMLNKRAVTDNPPVIGKNTVIQTKNGFILNRGHAFPERHILTNNQLSQVDVMAGDPTTLLLKQEDHDGKAVFIVYVFDKPDSPDAKDGVGPVKTLVTVFDCTAGN
jgi:hypothetical protein